MSQTFSRAFEGIGIALDSLRASKVRAADKDILRRLGAQLGLRRLVGNWLADDDGRRFDLIFLDPPTFSNSKSMEREFDVQRDHVELIRKALARLAPSGKLVFSTNLQRFKLDAGALGNVQVEDWSAETLPRDFARRPRIRSVYALTPV